MTEYTNFEDLSKLNKVLMKFLTKLVLDLPLAYNSLLKNLTRVENMSSPLFREGTILKAGY